MFGELCYCSNQVPNYSHWQWRKLQPLHHIPRLLGLRFLQLQPLLGQKVHFCSLPRRCRLLLHVRTYIRTIHTRRLTINVNNTTRRVLQAMGIRRLIFRITSDSHRQVQCCFPRQNEIHIVDCHQLSRQ